MSADLHTLGVAALGRALAAKSVSSVEATQALLARAQADTHGAFLVVDADAALAAAKAADAKRASGAEGSDHPLLGVPIAHKDIFVTAESTTTAGSKMLQGYKSPFDATVVARLKAAGTVSLGKLNCDEFAMGSANENSAYGPVRNPWDATRVPGGSSGGSATAVAAQLVPAATGTDTGGSIRQPARAFRRGLRAAAVGDERLRRARRHQRAEAAAGFPRADAQATAGRHRSATAERSSDWRSQGMAQLER